MNRTFKIAVFVVLLACGLVTGAYAGNPDRAGEAGAYELLINPFARSSGLYGLNAASTQGVESMVVNPAGLAYTHKTELVFTYTDWLAGTGINIAALGVAQKFGKDTANVIGLNLTDLSFGKIPITTTANPEGGLGTFSPNFINIGLGYSRIFSNSITAGVIVRLVNEKISNLAATGACLDVGIQYVTGAKKNIHFGIALRNVGLPMKYEGEGLTFTGNAIDGDYTMSESQRSQAFELPSQLTIGVAYDWYIDKANNNNRLSFNGAFIANSFGDDQYGVGIEYGYKKYFQLRVAYRYQAGITDPSTSITALTGLAAGITVDVPSKNNGPVFGIDYSYRTSSPFNGTHSIGLHFNL